MDLLVACHPQMSSAQPPTSVPWVSAQTDEFWSSKIVRWQKFNGFKIRQHLLRRNFRPMAVYPPIAPSTFHWFWLPTGHGPATLPCDAVESPTTRQIGDSRTFNWIVIGVWLVGYRKHRALISDSSADDWSGSGHNLFERGGSDQMSAVTPVIILPRTYLWQISLFSHRQVSCVSCYLPVIVRHFSDELWWRPDENVLPVSHQCLVTIRLPTGCSDHTPASNVPAPSLRDKLKCVQPISDEIGRKWKIRFPTSFRPATGLCGRGALTSIELSSQVFCDIYLRATWSNKKWISYLFNVCNLRKFQRGLTNPIMM